MKKILNSLWNSPTFTSWAGYITRSLRLLVLTPLILTRFDATEIAAWYLFASINIFGTIVSQRLNLTFSRMIAFAFGGAKDLSPLRIGEQRKNSGEVEWEVLGKVYGTVGFMNLALSVVNVFVALVIGWVSLNNILGSYSYAEVIWFSFAILQLTSFLSFVLQRWSIALLGLGEIALVNRWGVISGIVSVLAGAITLLLGGGMIALVCVMQASILFGLLINRILIGQVFEGKMLSFRAYRFDRTIIGWAWPPTWKGFLGQWGVMGTIQVSVLLYTGQAEAAAVGSYLFSINIMQTIMQFAQTPYSAIQPLMSKMLIQGKKEELYLLIRKKIQQFMLLMLIGVGVAGLTMTFALDLISANIEFIGIGPWLLLGVLLFLSRCNILLLGVSAIGNQIVMYWESFAALLFGALGMYLWGQGLGVYGPILFSTLPLIIILNKRPYMNAVRVLRN